MLVSWHQKSSVLIITDCMVNAASTFNRNVAHVMSTQAYPVECLPVCLPG